jgi:hypothetical protein
LAESGEEMVKYRMQYPYSFVEHDRYIKYDVNNPAYVSFRRVRGDFEPQEGHDRCHPEATPVRQRTDTYDPVISKAPAQPRLDEDTLEQIPCR